MKFAIFDTETSGLFDFSKPADADGQPRLASLHMLRLDEAGEIEGAHDFLISPDGWEMQSGAESVNGLSTDHLKEHGVPVREVLDFYTSLIGEGFTLAAFNAQFDTKVMRAELRRAGMNDLFEATPNVCLMRACIGVCKIPRARGGGYKMPKLSEACQHFGIQNDAEHTARGDTMAAHAIFKALRRIDALPTPTVHYAKNRPEAAA